MLMQTPKRKHQTYNLNLHNPPQTKPTKQRNQQSAQIPNNKYSRKPQLPQIPTKKQTNQHQPHPQNSQPRKPEQTNIKHQTTTNHKQANRKTTQKNTKPPNPNNPKQSQQTTQITIPHHHKSLPQQN